MICVYFFIKCVVRWFENSVKLKNLMGIGFQMGQILWDMAGSDKCAARLPGTSPKSCWASAKISSSIYFYQVFNRPLLIETGRGSSMGSESAWHASDPKFDPHIWHVLSWRLGHENISTAILSLPLIQEEQLSVTGERMCSMFPLAFVALWLQGHWWGFISRNYVVWSTFLLMNVFIALKGSHYWFLFYLIWHVWGFLLAICPNTEQYYHSDRVQASIFTKGLFWGSSAKLVKVQTPTYLSMGKFGHTRVVNWWPSTRWKSQSVGFMIAVSSFIAQETTQFSMPAVRAYYTTSLDTTVWAIEYRSGQKSVLKCNAILF